MNEDKSNNSSNGNVNSLVIGLNKSFQTLNIENSNTSSGMSLSPHRNINNNQLQQQQQQTDAPQIATTANTTNNISFKTVTPNKTRQRALSPLSKEKQRVSFSPLVVEIEDEHVNNNINNNNNNNNNNNIETDNNNNNNNNNNIESSKVANNNNQLNSQNINIFLHSLNNVSNENRMTFNKLSGSSSEIFQFDEEYEDEMEEIKEKTGPVITEVEMADSDDEPTHATVEGGNRSRSNGIMQELKLGTSLPVEIPSKLAQSLQKSSFAPMDLSVEEKKKYVTPRQSWVDTMNNKDEMSMSFAVPLSLSRKSKSYI